MALTSGSNKQQPQPVIDRIKSTKLGPFVLKISHHFSDGSVYHWTSRAHRKGSGHGAINQTSPTLSQQLLVFRPTFLSWCMAMLFMIGAACFAAPCINEVWPGLISHWLEDVDTINIVFFVGSIFFTSAAYLQLLEVVNADRRAELEAGVTPTNPFTWFSWQPNQIGWLSAFIQLVGTLFFNLNTFDVMLSDLNWLQQDLLIWTPDIIGCVCFLVASGLAVIEECHSFWAWKPRSISWWVVMVNMLGSIAFMVAGVFTLVLPSSQEVLDLYQINLWTLVGAACFFVGAYLTLPEMTQWKRPAMLVRQQAHN
ncbi:hypothetical protein EZV61_00535 [Corallincola luteus]|uniref:YrhK domain-containing protein n=1 Tax=Corallincola luteus TaxID=1775177 RepID=A0ABY2AMR5_9GAMM|nr:hypothetical protein [Corallincola luteus]TCI04499.1 hypothetical protein EZV61_00535 [Corallincola luteus]